MGLMSVCWGRLIRCWGHVENSNGHIYGHFFLARRFSVDEGDRHMSLILRINEARMSRRGQRLTESRLMESRLNFVEPFLQSPVDTSDFHHWDIAAYILSRGWSTEIELIYLLENTSEFCDYQLCPCSDLSPKAKAEWFQRWGRPALGTFPYMCTI